MNLGEWDKLIKYNEDIPEENPDKLFWSAAVSIHKNKLDDAKLFIN